VAGQPYERFLAERIFRPLEMNDTFFFVPADKASRVATVYTYENDGLKRALIS
jgi:CubicO group peptidase (beta-lactamase class C family)